MIKPIIEWLNSDEIKTLTQLKHLRNLQNALAQTMKKGELMSYKSKPGYVDNLLILRGLCSYGVLLAHSLNMIPGFIIIDYLSHNLIINEGFSNLII